MNKAVISITAIILLSLWYCKSVVTDDQKSQIINSNVRQQEQQGETNETTDFKKREHNGFKGADAEKYLEQQVPELCDYAKYISKQSGGKAFLIIESDGRFHDIKQGSEYKEYFMVYVGEQWKDRRVNWDWFYVDKKLEEILWYNLPEDKTYSLSEWRDSAKYKTRKDLLGRVEN